MTSRRSQTSAAAPARRENSMMGNELAAWTSATMSAEGAIEVISHEAPTPWIRLPKFETRLAVQMARNMRCRNGARVEERQAPRPSSAPAFKGFVRATAALRTRANRSRAGRFPREPSRFPPRRYRRAGLLGRDQVAALG